MLSITFIVILMSVIFLGIIFNIGNKAPTPGPEFQVNTYTNSNQWFPAVAMDSTGNFVITYESSGYDGSLDTVCAQRYDNVGIPIGSEFQVNTYTTNNQNYPSITIDPNGNFIITWMSNGQDGSDKGVYAQRYNNNGNPQGLEFQVNTYTTDNQSYPDVAMSSNGDFVIVWASEGQDGSGYGIYGQRYDSSGVPQGSELQVNTYISNDQEMPAVAMDPNGNFVVVWESEGQDGSEDGVFARLYNNTGTPIGTEFQVNTYNTSFQRQPSVAMGPSGNFVITWESNEQDGSARGCYAQRYNHTGTPIGLEFQVNTYTQDIQDDPMVAMDSDDNFVITWMSNGQDGSSSGIYAKEYVSTGIPSGSEFQVNEYTSDGQYFPSIAMNSSANFIVTWSSWGQDNSGSGVFARLYTGEPPGISNVLLDDGVSQGSTLVVENSQLMTVFLNATIDDSNTGNSTIFSANYTVGKDNWISSIPMDPTDGAFDEPIENVTITINISSWPGGTYELWVYGSDVLGNLNLTGARVTLIIQDTTPPIISDVTAVPDPQEVYEVVNISANITDIGQIFGVSVEIYDPDLNFVGNFSMLYDPINGRYYWNLSYDILGTYTFTIYVNDTSDNWNSYSGSFVIQSTLILKQGWNLISLPLIQEEQDLKKVLSSIDGLYDAVQWYDITYKNDHWKHHKVGKPFGSDLIQINETMGFWIHVTQPGDTVFYINGTRIYQNQSITLHEGWNLVGYPSRTSYNRTVGLNKLTFGQEIDLIQWHDPSTQTWHDMGEDDNFVRGRGYWVHAKTECEWEVPI
jgi:hypothetical protein